MKLRMRGNSIRLRLSRPETREIAEGRGVRERVNFGVRPSLSYSLLPESDATGISARFEDGEIAVSLPLDLAREWAGSDLVSLEASQAGLSILVEKDFYCRSPRSHPEDERDLFPNPHGGSCG